MMHATKLSEIMSTNIIYVKSSDSIEIAALLMNEHKIGSALVKDNGVVVGIITERDILKSIKKGAINFLNQSVSNLMTKNIVTAESSDPVSVGEKLMHKWNFRHLPIVNETGEIVGIVSTRDIFRALNHEEQMRQKHLENANKMIINYTHELYKPLENINGGVKSLNQKFDQNGLNTITEGVSRISEIIKKISEFRDKDENKS